MIIDDFLIGTTSSNVKQCKKCKLFKPVENFPLKGGTTLAGKKHRRPNCRKCYNAQSGAKNGKIRRSTRNRIFLVEYFKTHPCVDCGNTDIRVLEFDHIGIKKDQISNIIDRSLERIKKEIQQCEVRCANCHRIKTMERGNHYRQTAYEMMQRGEVYGILEGSNTEETHTS